MGNSFIFPAPKCSYTTTSLLPFYTTIPPEPENSSTSPSRTTIRCPIPALHIKTRIKSKYLFIYTHGNSEDLGRLYMPLLDYYERFQIDILAPEYPGYGLNKGKACEKSIIRTAEQAILYASSPEGLGYDIKNIILIGRSIGTGVAMEMAIKFPELKGVIFISAFTSIREVAQRSAGSVSKYLISDMFKNIEIVEHVRSPSLFIHGKRDQIIPFAHSLALYTKAKCAKKVVLSDGMDHNHAKMEKDIYKPIESFLLEELQINDLPQLFPERAKMTQAVQLSKQNSMPVETSNKSKNKRVPLLEKTWKGFQRDEEEEFKSPEIVKSKSSINLYNNDENPFDEVEEENFVMPRRYVIDITPIHKWAQKPVPTVN